MSQSPSDPSPDGSYPQQGRPYPSQQGAGFPSPAGPTGGSTRPASVDASVMLWVVTLALGVLGAVIAYLSQDALIDAGIQEGLRLSGVTEADLPPGALEEARAQAASTPGTLVVSTVLVLLMAGLVLLMRNGRNWARITLTVLGVLYTVLGLLSLLAIPLLVSIGIVGVVSVLATVLQVILVVAAIVFMYRPDARPWFQRATVR